MTNHAFIQSIRNASFPIAEFKHKQHLKFTYLCITSDQKDLKNDIAEGIYKLVKANGAADHFDAELTAQAIALVEDRIKEKAYSSFEEFIAANSDLLNNFKLVLKEFQTKQVDSKI